MYDSPSYVNEDENTKSSSFIFGFTVWNDPQGDFSIEYPSDWTVKEKENRFDPTDVTFTSPASAINGYVGVDYGDTTVEEYDKLIEAGLDESVIWERLFDRYIEGFSPSIDNFREVEDRDFSKYTIIGEPAASVVFAGEIIGQEIAGLLVVSLVNDRIFNLSYGTSNSIHRYHLLLLDLQLVLVWIVVLGYHDLVVI